MGYLHLLPPFTGVQADFVQDTLDPFRYEGFKCSRDGDLDRFAVDFQPGSDGESG